MVVSEDNITPLSVVPSLSWNCFLGILEKPVTVTLKHFTLMEVESITGLKIKFSLTVAKPSPATQSIINLVNVYSANRKDQDYVWMSLYYTVDCYS